MLPDTLLTSLQEALDLDGAYSLADVAEEIQAGRAQIWVSSGKDACVVTVINDAPRRKELHFWLAAGRLKTLFKMLPVIEDWGREQGCNVATLVGRRGWARPLAGHGWRRKMEVLEKDL